MLVKSDLEQYRSDSEDIVKNLFKVCCAILNLRSAPSGVSYLDEKLLQTYLEGINFHRDDPELVLIDQLATIKSLINRRAYNLTERQIKMIHDKFRNMYENRENYLYIKDTETITKKKIMSNRQFDPKNSAKGPSYSEAKARNFTEKKPMYSAPRANNTVRKADRSVSQKRVQQPVQRVVQQQQQRVVQQ